MWGDAPIGQKLDFCIILIYLAMYKIMYFLSVKYTMEKIKFKNLKKKTQHNIVMSFCVFFFTNIVDCGKVDCDFSDHLFNEMVEHR